MDDLKTLFTKSHGYFSKRLQFEVVVIIVAILVVFPSIFEKNYAFIVLLIAFALFIANSYTSVRTETLVTFNNETMIMLNKIQAKTNEYINKQLQAKLSPIEKKTLIQSSQMSSLYLDADLIRFIHDILTLAEYNPVEFYKFVKATNNILKIREDVSLLPENTSELFEIAINLKSNAINSLHNFIYTVPKTNVMYDYLQDITTKYNILITRNLDTINTFYKKFLKTNGINTRTKFVSYDRTKPFDQFENHSVIPSKSDNTLLQFYV
jgi:hypothetical protein